LRAARRRSAPRRLIDNAFARSSSLSKGGIEGLESAAESWASCRLPGHGSFCELDLEVNGSYLGRIMPTEVRSLAPERGRPRHPLRCGGDPSARNDRGHDPRRVVGGNRPCPSAGLCLWCVTPARG
jgi:hypothetical protein